MVSKPWSSIVKSYNNIPTRLPIGLMLFMACFIAYMLRTNISVNILAMTNNGSVQPNFGPRYNYTSKDQSIILGGYFWGYLLTSLSGGYLSEQFGGRHVVGVATIASVISTAIVPLAAEIGPGPWAVVVCRVLTGAAGGPIWPALHNLISKWAPPDEKGKFVSALLGGTFGTVLTWSIVGFLIESVGWAYAFYVPALIALAMTVVWYAVVSDSPATHPRISAKERDYIEKSLGSALSNEKHVAPYGKILTSIPFWALLILHYGNLWGLYFLITAAPMFLNTVLGFDLAHAGFLAALPYLARLIFGFMFGSIGDVVRGKNVLSITSIRKLFTISSHVIPGLFLVGMCFVHEPAVCVTLITLSLGFNGASTVTNLQNSQDLAPNFAGSLYGIINFVGTTSGFLTPLMVAYFTKDSNTVADWTNIFVIGAVAYIAPAVVFALFGSGEVQKWNDSRPKPKAGKTEAAEQGNPTTDVVTTTA